MIQRDMPEEARYDSATAYGISPYLPSETDERTIALSSNGRVLVNASHPAFKEAKKTETLTEFGAALVAYVGSELGVEEFDDHTVEHDALANRELMFKQDGRKWYVLEEQVEDR